MSKVDEMTLTDFLVARIAEDEGLIEGEFWDRITRDRLFAECVAKRAVVAEHASREIASLDKETWGQAFQVCRTCAIGPRQIVAPCPTLKHLAAIYKDHPDYQEKWTLDGCPIN